MEQLNIEGPAVGGGYGATKQRWTRERHEGMASFFLLRGYKTHLSRCYYTGICSSFTAPFSYCMVSLA